MKLEAGVRASQETSRTVPGKLARLSLFFSLFPCDISLTLENTRRKEAAPSLPSPWQGAAAWEGPVIADTLCLSSGRHLRPGLLATGQVWSQHWTPLKATELLPLMGVSYGLEAGGPALSRSQ